MSYAYVGCRTTRERNARGKGLKVYEISEATGEWKEIQCLETLPNPSYQAMDLEEKYLYSVHGDNTQVSSYKIEADRNLICLKHHRDRRQESGLHHTDQTTATW